MNFVSLFTNHLGALDCLIEQANSFQSRVALRMIFPFVSLRFSDNFGDVRGWTTNMIKYVWLEIMTENDRRLHGSTLLNWAYYFVKDHDAVEWLLERGVHSLLWIVLTAKSTRNLRLHFNSLELQDKKDLCAFLKK